MVTSSLFEDEDGFLFIEGRIKRIIVRYDRFKVFPSMIENVVLENNKVHECCSVGISDTNHAHGMLPVVYVELSSEGLKEKEEAVKEIKKLCREDFPEYVQPKGIKVIDTLPLTSIGKVEYRKLETMANNA